MKDYSWRSFPLLTVDHPIAETYAKNTKRKSRVDWAVDWSAPHEASLANTSIPMEEAERRLCEIARAAVHHAVVSGKASVRITVTRARPLGKDVR